jgi:hypothetical protein
MNQITNKDKVLVWYTRGMTAKIIDDKKLSDNPFGSQGLAAYAWAAGWNQEKISPQQIINDAQSHAATRYIREQN